MLFSTAGTDRQGKLGKRRWRERARTRENAFDGRRR